MNTIEHLRAIKTRCQELLTFTSGPAKAAIKVTIAAIETIFLTLPIDAEYGVWQRKFIENNDHAQELAYLAKAITEAWPAEYLMKSTFLPKDEPSSVSTNH